MTDDHRSIGEVLGLLRDEFPDVTVSKIRFLESQGLIAPERTPSGYRKFYEPDIQRLRWILTQQRDHYLPLKVIKKRLTSFEEKRAVEAADGADEAVVTTTESEEPPASVDRAGDPLPTGDAVLPDDEADDASEGRSDAEDPDPESEALTRAELAKVSGLDERLLRELESFGLLPAPRTAGNKELYDEQAVVVARLARGFLRHGVEARHLRMYKTSADREAAFVSQLVAPILRQKNPEARQRARDTVSELARLGGGMRAALLRMALRDAFSE